MIYETSIDTWVWELTRQYVNGKSVQIEEAWETIMACVHKGRLPLQDVLRMSLSRFGTTVKILNKWGRKEDPLEDL